MFSSGNKEPGNQFKSSFCKHVDPSNLGTSLLEGNKDHLLSQARSELMRQDHQVGSFNNCISELQQQACAQRLELQDAQHGYIESRREQVFYKKNYLWNKTFSEILKILSMHEMGEMKRAQELWVDWDSMQKLRENHETNSAALCSVAANARTDEFYEWFWRFSRCGIKLQWEIVFRFQSACDDSKFSIHAEPRQMVASWHIEYIGITGKLSWWPIFYVCFIPRSSSKSSPWRRAKKPRAVPEAGRTKTTGTSSWISQ